MNPFMITLTYKDDKQVTVHLTEDQIDLFFKKINAGEVFQNEKTSVGFWTSVDQLRHIIVQPKPKENANEPQGKDRCSDQPIQDGDQDNQGRAEAANGA